MNVLVVDDESLNRLIMKRMVEKLGYEVCLVRNRRGCG